MNPATALVAMSIRQALPLRRSTALGLLQLAPAIIYLIASASRTEEAALQALIQIGGAMLFTIVVPITAMVVAASSLGAERREQTLSFIALRPIPRTALGGGKILAPIVGAGALNLLGATALSVAHVVRYGSPSLLPALAAGVLVTTAIYVPFVVALGFLTDRAVIIGLAFLLVFENGVIAALPALATISPWRYGLITAASISTSTGVHVADMTGRTDLGAADAVLAVVVALVLGTLLTAQLLRQRDLA